MKILAAILSFIFFVSCSNESELHHGFSIRPTKFANVFDIIHDEMYVGSIRTGNNDIAVSLGSPGRLPNGELTIPITSSSTTPPLASLNLRSAENPNMLEMHDFLTDIAADEPVGENENRFGGILHSYQSIKIE